MEMLWPESDPSSAMNSLGTTVHLLRRTLDASGSRTFIRTEGDSLALIPSVVGMPAEDWLDSVAFEYRAHTALRGEDAGACSAALELYTGEYLPDDPYEVWTEPTRGRLHRLRLELLMHLARVSSARGDMGPAERALRDVLDDDPGHEDAAAALMRLLASSGRGSDALRVYRALAEVLEKDLGVAPGMDIEALRGQILVQSTGGPAPAAVSGPADPHRTNVVGPLTSFIGRDWDRAELVRLLGEARAVTLTGPGGCGKTRLALELAGDLLGRYRDGVWLAELAGQSDPGLVPQMVSGVLGVREQPNAPLVDTLQSALEGTEMLLILDNCEHLASASAHLITALLTACPHLHVLSTSREPLGVAGEIAYRVPPLAAPDPDSPAPIEQLLRYEAVALLRARGRATSPDFEVTPENAAAVTRVCARLDGLPLAIELAAARLRVLPVERIAERLDDHLGLVSGGPRTALPRQQTLRATIDWSYALLPPVERTLLGRLAVFRGGWNLDASGAVCAGGDVTAGDVLDRIDWLVHKSLVARDGRGGEPRYVMLETIRQYAHEQLRTTGAEETSARSHATYFASFAERSGPGLATADQPTTMDALLRDLDNLRSATQWALQSGDVGLGMRIVAPIWRFWMVSGRSSEGRRWIERLLKSSQADAVAMPTLALCLYAGGTLAAVQGDSSVAESLYTRSLNLRRQSNDVRGVAEVLNGLGVAAMHRGDFDQAEERFEESASLQERLGHETGRLAPLNNLALIAKYRGRQRRAAELHEECLAIERRAGNISGVVQTLTNLAQVLQDLGQYERADTLVEECLALAREYEYVGTIPIALNTRGSLELAQGRLDAAEASFTECIDVCQSTGDRITAGLTRGNLAEVVLARGDVRRAKELAEEALEMAHANDHRRGQAFALGTLTEVARIEGDLRRAGELLKESEGLHTDMRDSLGMATCFEARARLAGTNRQYAEAARCYGTATALRTLLQTPLAPVWHNEHETDLARLREELGEDAFAALFAQGESAAPSLMHP
jgi:non-specific serine/threonine protein kinase